MPRLKITCNGDPKDRRNKLKLLEILAPADVYANELYEAHDGYIINASEREVDTVLESTMTRTLQDQGFFPILPPEIKAKRTIICYKVEQTAFEKTNNDIADEIENKQEWAKVQEAYKFPSGRDNINKNMLKIQFETISMADKAMNHGLRLFNVSIAPHQITKERYVQITFCMKCYAIEDHITKQCPKPAGYKVCSECSSQDHTWKNCPKETVKCINCGEAHRTLAYKCSKRKEKVKEKLQEEKQKTSQSYSQAVGHHTNATTTFPTSDATIGNTQVSKMMLCYVHAHAMNTVQPGTFQKTLIDLLNENNLPTVILPNNPPSQLILQNLMPFEEKQNPDTQTNNTDNHTADAAADLDLSSDSEEEQDSEEEEQEIEMSQPIPSNNKQDSTKTSTRHKSSKQVTQTVQTTSNNHTLHTQASPPPQQKTTTTRHNKPHKARCSKRH